MCWACDHPGATRQDYLNILQQTIHDYGWAVQYVESDRRPFAYTAGLSAAGLPELLITGLPPEISVRLLNAVADYLLHERVPVAGDTMSLPDGWFVEFVDVAEPTAHLTFAVEMYGPGIRALQLAWRDMNGHSPWCPEFNRGGTRQPVLGVRDTG